jgi:uncharacterized membrane protein
VNHHHTLKVVDKSSSSIIYANGFLLLTIVFIPFPTALLGKYLFTDHAALAVLLYNAFDVLQAIGWILLCRTALKPTLLTKNEKSTLAMRENYKKGYFVLIFYLFVQLLLLGFL